MKIRKTPEEPEIPTASMADIAFLLIIFFMLTTVFSVTKGLDFSMPKEEETEPDQDAADILYTDAAAIIGNVDHVTAECHDRPCNRYS